MIPGDAGLHACVLGSLEYRVKFPRSIKGQARKQTNKDRMNCS